MKLKYLRLYDEQQVLFNVRFLKITVSYSFILGAEILIYENQRI